MYDVFAAAVGGKQPNGRFRPGVIAGPYAEHDLAHYVIDAFGAGLARSGARPYLEYDPEVSLEGAAAAANAKAPSCADLVAFGQARPGGVAVEVARGTTSANRSAAERACRLVADACGVAPLGVRNGDRPWLGQTTVPSWWVECACLDASDDQQALSRASFLVAAGEALAQARCGFLGIEYRDSCRGSAAAEGGDRILEVHRSGWFKSNHPILALGAGSGDEPSDPTAHLQTLLGVLVDGRFGYATQSALQAVQRRFAPSEDGVCGPASWAVLHPVERQGSVGYTTKEIQRELSISDDGIFGPQTAAHVEAFQRAADTTTDGRMTAAHYRLLLA